MSERAARRMASWLCGASLVLAAACGGDGTSPVASPTPAPSGTASAVPSPTPAPVDARLWAIGVSADARVLIRSDDGGASWSTPLLTGSLLTAPSFTDRAHGWIADGARFLRSSDGGEHWTDLEASIALPPSPYEPASTSVVLDQVTAVVALDDARAIAVGRITYPDLEPLAEDTGVVLVTGDGGATWRSTNVGLPYDDLCSTTGGVALARAYQAAERPAAEQSFATVESSTDDGASWTTVVRETGGISGTIHLGHPVCGEGTSTWLVGAYPLTASGAAAGPSISYSSDAGATWARQSTLSIIGDLSAGSFVGPSVGWAVGDRQVAGGNTRPLILFTDDAGGDWREQALPDLLGRLRSVAALDDRSAVAVGTEIVDTFPEIGQALVLITRDGGSTWTSVRLAREIESLSAVVGAR